MAYQSVYKKGPYLHWNGKYYDLNYNTKNESFVQTYIDIPYTLPDIKGSLAGLIIHVVPEAFPISSGNKVLNMDSYIVVLDMFDEIKNTPNPVDPLPNPVDPLPKKLRVLIREWLTLIPTVYNAINKIPSKDDTVLQKQQDILLKIPSLLVNYETLETDDIPNKYTPSPVITPYRAPDPNNNPYNPAFNYWRGGGRSKRRQKTRKSRRKRKQSVKRR